MLTNPWPSCTFYRPECTRGTRTFALFAALVFESLEFYRPKLAAHIVVHSETTVILVLLTLRGEMLEDSEFLGSESPHHLLRHVHRPERG